MNSTIYPMMVIAREKLNGFGEHWGLLLPNGMVVHNTSGRGQHMVTLAEFAAGKQLKEIRRVPVMEHQATIQRVQYALGNPHPYHPVLNNCEMFANLVTGKGTESPQVTGWLIILGLVGLLAAAR